MKKMKRLIGVVLSIVIAVMLMPGSLTNLKVEAKASVIDSGTCGPKLTWQFDSDGVLTISGTGAMYNYNSSQVPWQDYRSGKWGYNDADEYVRMNYVKKVVVKNGVTTIGDCAFYYLGDASSIALPNTIETIGKHAFYNSGVTALTLPKSLLSVDEYAFAYCKKLQKITIPSSVRNIGAYAFSNCEMLSSIVLPDSAQVGESMFISCSNLTSVVLGKGLTAVPPYFFEHCKALTHVVIPEGVTTIEYGAFYNCQYLRQVSIPKTVTKIGNNAFSLCKQLWEVDYGGSQADWASIEKGYSNDPLNSATIYYNAYNPFIDISGSDWYFKSVLWAYDSGVTAGTTTTTFEPGKTCNRAEFVSFLYKFVGKPWNDSWAKECSFSDVKTSNWYYKAVVWANHAGVTNGVKGKFLPNQTLDRGMIISFLYNMEKYQNGKPAITLKTTKFQDVKAGSYYYTPVLWAQQYNITSGTSATTFSPEKKCTRAEAVSFLYNINKYWKK